ncbi:hypothetical protein LINGRAHAP2_LOCUS12813 [Linum grandiflorum]
MEGYAAVMRANFSIHHQL